MAIYKKITEDVKKLISLGAPEEDIDAHIQQSGGTVAGLKRYNEVKDKSLGQIVSDNFVSALKQTHSEGVSPVAKGLDTAAFGLPRTVLKAFNPELDKKLFPDQETLNGKVANIGFTVVGLLKGGASQLATATGKMIPRAAAEGLGKKVIRGAAMGAVGAGSQFVGDPEEKLLDQIGRQGYQALIGGTFGAALPVAGAGLGKAGRAIRDFKKGAEGYVSDVIAPKMTTIIRAQVQKMNPQFVKYVENKLKIPARSLEVIRKKGEIILDQMFASTKGLADDIESRLRSGLQTRGQIADDAYGQVMANVPEEQLFNANKTQRALKKTLINKGLIDGAGERTARASIAPGPDKILLDVHDDILRIKNPTKNDFIFWREKLSSAYKEVGYTNIDVKSGIDNLYDDAVESGYKGLQEARDLYRGQVEMEKRFLKSGLTKANKLSNYNKWSASEKQQLDDLVSYIQDDFKIDVGIIDDLESTIASKHLQVLKEQTGPSAIRSELIKAKSPENFNTVKNKFAEILGKDADPIFEEIKQVMRGERNRRIAEKAIIPIAAALGAGAIAFKGYGAYRLGSEALHDLIGNSGVGGE